jgi:hypothetical protein
MPMKKVTAAQAKNRTGKTDWNRVKAITDTQIETSARLDPDARLIYHGCFRRGKAALKS